MSPSDLKRLAKLPAWVDLDRDGAPTLMLFAAGVKPVNLGIVDSVLSTRIDDLEPELTRHGYDAKAIADQFGARVAEVHRLFRGTIDDGRTRELIDEMRDAGLPV